MADTMRAGVADNGRSWMMKHRKRRRLRRTRRRLATRWTQATSRVVCKHVVVAAAVEDAGSWTIRRTAMSNRMMMLDNVVDVDVACVAAWRRCGLCSRRTMASESRLLSMARASPCSLGFDEATRSGTAHCC